MIVTVDGNKQYILPVCDSGKPIQNRVEKTEFYIDLQLCVQGLWCSYALVLHTPHGNSKNCDCFLCFFLEVSDSATDKL